MDGFSNSGFSLSNLNLSGVDLSSGGGYLKPGRYIVKTSEAKLVPLASNDGSMKLEIRLTATDGSGSLVARLNIHNKKSKENTEIALKELKSMLFYGGHPNPDFPGAISTYNGLTVGALIKAGQQYKDKNGVDRIASDPSAFFDPADIDPVNFSPRPGLPKQNTASRPLDDGIPF